MSEVRTAFTVVFTLQGEILVLANKDQVALPDDIEIVEQATAEDIAAASRYLAHELDTQLLVARVVAALNPSKPTTADKIRAKLAESEE